MYHFVSERTAEVRVSENVLIPSKTTQYLKSFQLEAVRFLYKRLSQQEFCILNDESGLGKTASVVALLSGLGTAKKTLVVLQNDEQLLAGWQFHLGVLTDLSVCVIKDVNDTTESAHSVYLSKWSVLRSIGDLSKLNFDYIIVDHRGYTLNNNFCTSMLLKQFEGKVNIVISSVDITSDVKLLYKVMQLGGCLDHQFNSFRSFESKFRLPDVQEVLSKRVDLEEYYKQRGILGEYIKDYRLRRYRHQFDSCLPLVTAEQYKRNVSLWLGENNSNSTISDSTGGSKTSEVPSTGDTEEIFGCLLSLQQERHLAERQEPDKISLSEQSDDVIAMEPLILESESEPEVEADAHANKCSTNVVLLSSDDCEIIESSKSAPMTSNSPAKRKYTKRVQAPKSVELTESETEEPPNTSTITRKVLNVRLRRASIQIDPTNSAKASELPTKAVKASPKKSPNSPRKPKLPIKPEPKTPKRDTLLPVTPKTEPRSGRSNGNKNVDVEPRQTRGMQRLTRSAESRSNSKYMTQLKALDYEKKGTPRRKRNSSTNQTPKSSKVKEEKATVKQEIAVTPRTSKTTPMKMNQKEPEPKRTTRSRAEKEHFSNKLTSLPVNKRVEKVSSKTIKAPTAATLKPSESVPNNERKGKASPKVVTASSVTPDLPNSPLGSQKNGKASSKPVTAAPAATPEILSSGSILSDNSYLQCAQKLPENLAELEALELPEFRVPHAPPTTQLLLPVNLNLFSGSEVAVVPSPNPKPDVVVINSSHDESSQPTTKPSQSRRTRALKRKSVAPAKEQQSQPTTSRFGLMLAQHRGSVNKSPDIFSNCSETSQVSLAQPVPFEGFKIFGSEVRQSHQQLHDKTGVGMPAKRKRERSCLELLEKMFEPHQANHNEPGVQLLPDLPSPKQQLPQRRFTLLDDDIFEITNNGEFGSRLRVDSTGNVSPVQTQQLAQRNKITNYLISSGGAPEDTGQRTQSNQLLRKSPKPVKSTQSTKLTRWFGTAISGGSQSAPSTPVLPTEAADRARLARSAGSKKRKRLVLDK
ncbi:protein suppressor of underreplication [Drosophila mojavensis]|uniref:SuUR, isoform B n=1 Tax=Drosophila mojavensis TaxID=7230 RepID=B4KW27_DROMO|nr:protein suppressor of underreplication [Drosophila mojavensis]EDW19578.2 SuUR, isoform B [Drosophila mojavensis]KRG06696.1 SuUR, isoform C [Drosophila mojavensis]